MAAVWLAVGQQAGNGSVAGRAALVAMAVLAVGAFAVLQIAARSRGRRRSEQYGPADHRPDWKYGYPPGYEPYPLYDPARSPWAARDAAGRGQRTQSGAGPGAGRPSLAVTLQRNAKTGCVCRPAGGCERQVLVARAATTAVSWHDATFRFDTACL